MSQTRAWTLGIGCTWSKIRELITHEDMIEVRTISKDGTNFKVPQPLIMQGVVHGITMYFKMYEPERRKDIEKKLGPLIAKLDCHFMVPSSESGETFRAPCKNAYKYLVRGLKPDQVKGQFYTSGPMDISAPCWSIEYQNVVVIRCDTEPYAGPGSEIVSRIKIAGDLKIAGKAVDLELFF